MKTYRILKSVYNGPSTQPPINTSVLKFFLHGAGGPQKLFSSPNLVFKPHAKFKDKPLLWLV
jgi:hypothetical protein